MKINNSIQVTRKLQPIFIVIMICLVFSQQAMSLQIQMDEKQLVEVTDEDNAEEQFVLKSTSMVSPSAQTHIHHVFYEIMDIEYDTKQDQFRDFQSPIDSESYLRIIFRWVISPNAP